MDNAEGSTFICAECGEELPVDYRHKEKPEVCFLDYVSDTDREVIRQAVDVAVKHVPLIPTTARWICRKCGRENMQFVERIGQTLKCYYCLLSAPTVEDIDMLQYP